MVRDYAKRSTPKPRRKKRIFVTALIIIAAIMIPASMYYLKHQNVIHRNGQAIRKKLAIDPITTVRPRPNKPPTINKQSEFDFYTILPKMQVQIPSSTNTGLEITGQAANSRYILQVASLQSLRQAQELKDKLFSLGHSATITSFESKDGVIWNRVMTGPYSSLDEAETAQSNLKQQHIDGILIKID